MFCLNLMRIALELARENPVYEGLASKFLQHYTYVAYAMKHMGNKDYSLFDEKDGFFYDVLSFPDGRFKKFRVRSLVGLIPLFAVERLELDWLEPFKEFTANLKWFIKNRREMTDKVIHKIERDGRSRTCSPSSTRSRSRGSWSACTTRRSSCLATASARCPSSTRRIRSSSTVAS